MYIYSELPISKPPEPHPKIDLMYARSRSFLDPSGMKALQIDEELHYQDLYSLFNHVTCCIRCSIK